MNHLRTIFFGSTSDSVLVLDRLFTVHPSSGNCRISAGSSQFTVKLVAVVTQPPRPVGRKQILTPTPVEDFARKRAMTVLTFPSNPEKPWLYQNEDQAVNTLSSFRPDLLISASYGQKIPTEAIKDAQCGGLNVHPSLLPRWRGADPVPWAILSGDHQTGVTVVTLSEKFDQGRIIAQKKVPITDHDWSDPFRTHLFTLGAELLMESLPDYLSGKNTGAAQDPTTSTYARRLKRADGYIPWEILEQAMRGQDVPPNERPGLLSFTVDRLPLSVERACRALSPWPGVWTEVQMKNERKRIKIINAHVEGEKLVLDTVQREGKMPTSYKDFQQDHPGYTP